MKYSAYTFISNFNFQGSIIDRTSSFAKEYDLRRLLTTYRERNGKYMNIDTHNHT